MKCISKYYKQPLHAITLTILIFIIVGSSCMISSSYIDRIIYPKWIMFSYGASIILIMSALSDIKRKIYLSTRDLTLIFSVIILFGIILMKSSQFKDLIKLYTFLCFYIACRLLSDKIDILRVAAWSFICSALISSIVAIKQLVDGKEMIGCYDNLVGFDITLVLGILSIIYLLKSGNIQIVFQILSYFMVLIFCILTVLTKSRLAILSLLICPLLYVKPSQKLHITIITLVLSTISLISYYDSYKYESTCGRSFILITSLTMLDTPVRLLSGYGEDGYISNYMISQSKKLKNESEGCRLRASNIIHPLNEFVLMAIKYGILVPLMIIGLIMQILLRDNSTPFTKSITVAIILYSLMSYPLKYPITWIAMAIVLSSSRKTVGSGFKLKFGMNFSAPIMIIGTILLTISSYSNSLYKNWKIAEMQAILGYNQEALENYRKLYGLLKTDDFIYNYSSYLHNLGDNLKAQSILSDIALVDYETKMLSGKINMALGKYNDAIRDFDCAYEMCPNRFFPLFNIYRIYENLNNEEQQIKYAKLIMNKHIKIPSKEIENIIEYVKIRHKPMSP